MVTNCSSLNLRVFPVLFGQLFYCKLLLSNCSMEALSWSSSGTFELMLLLMLIYSMINHYKFQLVKLIILYAAGCKRCYRQCLYFYPKLYDACYFRWVKYIYSGSLKNLNL